MLYRFALSFIIFSFCLLTSAKTIIRQYTNIDGLPNNSINCIYQDSNDESIWFGTWDGLSRFNGRDFQTYRYDENVHSISNNIIRQIIQTDSTSLWISTDFGINRFNKQTEQFDRYFSEEKSIQIKKEKGFIIGQLYDNSPIAFVNGLGLFYYDKQSDDFVLIKSVKEKFNIKKFVITKDNMIYFLHDNGDITFYKLSKTLEGTISSSDRTTNTEKTVNNIFYSNDKLIFYSDGTISIISLDNKEKIIDINKTKKISDIQCSVNELIISYIEGGIDTVDLTTNSVYSMPSFSESTPVFSIYGGSQGILWVGTDAQGVYQIYDYESAFSTINTLYPVRAFFQRSNNEILIGTKGGGIQTFNKETKTLHDFATTTNGLISNSVYTLVANKENDVFVGTEEGINIILQNNQIQKLNLLPTDPSFRSVYNIVFTDNDSTMWLGTSGFGLIKIKLQKKGNVYLAEQVQQFTTSNNTTVLNNDIIYSIIADEKNKILWVSTRRGGLYQFDMTTKKFTNLTRLKNHTQLSNNDILSLLIQDRNLWIGTSYGLNQLNLNNYNTTKYTTENGLLNNTVHGVLINKGDVWVSTNKGLSKIDQQNRSITNYTFEDGLQNDEFSDGAFYQGLDQLFYFGGVSGFNYFDPNKITLRNFQPQIAITSLRIFNDHLNVNERIKNNVLKLSYDDTYTILTFLAKDYIDNENCQYSYRLKNLSDEWINNDKNPNIVLTNLLPGKHELQVRVSNGDRVWSDYVYTLKIDVAYPWWLSTYAVVSYFVIFSIILILVYFFIRNKVRTNRRILLEKIEQENQKKIHESKLDFFTNVAHEFFTPLTLIYGPAQHLLETSNLDSYTKRYVQVIKKNAERMQKLISELMDFRKVESGHAPLNPEKIDIQLLLNYVIDNYIDISEETKIKLTVESANISDFVTDRNSLEKILFNLISNAFKYTPDNGFINIYVLQTEDKLEFRIKNSGKGLTEDQMSQIFNKFKIFGNTQLANSRSTGIGLSLVKSLTELLGGKISVNSKIKEYVEFWVELPPLSTNQEDKDFTNSEEDNNVSYLNRDNRKDIFILIVEDEKDIRELLKNILELHYTIEEAEDGKDALEKISQNTPDIIISDILMPRINGTELLKILKENKVTAHIPVINITAKTSLDDKINAYEQGADLYITKPFHPRHVLATIDNILKKQNLLKEYFSSSLSTMTVKDGIELHQDDEKLLQEIISYVEKNIDDENLNPNMIAEAFGFSKASLYRKLEKMTQKTPSEFVRSIRLNHAAHLLKSTKITVQEVMFRSGFSNKSYFYREFAKIYNASPNEYRKTNM